MTEEAGAELCQAQHIGSGKLGLVVFWLRGGIIIKKRENFGLFPKKTQISIKYKFRIFGPYGTLGPI